MTHCFKSSYPEYFANNQIGKIIENNIFHFLVNTFLCYTFVPVVFRFFAILFYFLFLSMFLVNTFFLFLNLFYLSKPLLQYNVTFYCYIIVTLLFYYCYMLFMLLYINTNTWNHLYVTIIFYYYYVLLLILLHFLIYLYIYIYEVYQRLRFKFWIKSKILHSYWTQAMKRFWRFLQENTYLMEV